MKIYTYMTSISSKTYYVIIYVFVYTFVCLFFFFFQAEDGIRDIGVTGVQTCALPILVRIDQLWHGPFSITLAAWLPAWEWQGQNLAILGVKLVLNVLLPLALWGADRKSVV